MSGLTKSVEFDSANINTQQKSIDIVKKSLVEANRDLQSATTSKANLEANVPDRFRETFPFF